MFKKFTRKEALALKEFLLGIQAVDESEEVRILLCDLEIYLKLDKESRELSGKKVEDEFDQIFDLGEALAKLPSSDKSLLKEMVEAQHKGVAETAHLDRY